MIKVSNEELSKIAQFIASCDDMINGKFILADVKITKVLNMIAGSEELYRYISECMVGFDFTKEYHRAEVKNGLNGGLFAVPSDPNKLVAFVFCVLVECDAKRLDFYNFINDNFGTNGKSEAYKNFSSQLLVPFKEIISSHFGLGGVSNQTLEEITNTYREELKNEPIFQDQFGQTNYDNASWQNQDYIVSNEQFEGVPMPNEQYINMPEQLNQYQNAYVGLEPNPKTEEPKENSVWKDICDICENVESAVYAERHLKEYLKEELLYILKTIKYSTKYQDVKIISALVTAFDELTKKFRSIQFVFGELKNKLEKLY